MTRTIATRSPWRSGSRIGFGLVLVALLGTFAWGQARRATPVRAYLEPSVGITDNQAIRLVLEVAGGGSQEVSQPTLPTLENLSVIAGPQISTNWVSVNGRASMTYKMIWTVFPDGPGPAGVPAIELRLGDQIVRTEPIRIEIQSSGATPGQPGSAPAGGNAEDEVRLSATLGETEVWVGQPVPLNVTLYAIPRVTQFSFHREAELAEFWVEEIATDPGVESRSVRIDGRVYRAYPVLRKILIPPGPGSYTVDPFIGQVTVMRSRDAFDWFRFGRSESELRRTQPVELVVRELPEAGRPKDFSGAVGNYTIDARMDRTEAAVNDAVALRVTIQGQGALRTVAAPRLDAPPDLEVFEPQVKESTVETRGGKVISKKTWEWLIVPLTPGDLELPDLSFDFFDPVAGAYSRVSAEPLRLAVNRGDGNDSEILQGPIAELRRDLAFIKPLRGELREHHPRTPDRAAFRILSIAPLLLAPLLVFLGRRQARLQRDHGLARGRKARSRARKQFQMARKRLEQVDSATFHEGVARALVEYIADRFNRSASGMTYESADSLLASRDVDSELRRRYRSCLESCDFARFVPAAAASERRGELLDEATQVVDALERAL